MSKSFEALCHRVLAVAGTALLTLSPAQATVTTSGCQAGSFCRLQELIDGGSITVDLPGQGLDVVLSGFSFSYGGREPDIGGPLVVDTSHVLVVPTQVSAGGLPVSLLFDTLGEFREFSASRTLYSISFEIAPLHAGQRIAIANERLLLIEHDVIDELVISGIQAQVGWRMECPAFPDEFLCASDSAVGFAPALALPRQVLLTALVAGDDPGTQTSVQAFEYRIGLRRVPEPGALALVGMAFAAAGIARSGSRRSVP